MTKRSVVLTLVSALSCAALAGCFSRLEQEDTGEGASLRDATADGPGNRTDTGVVETDAESDAPTAEEDAGMESDAGWAVESGTPPRDGSVPANDASTAADAWIEVDAWGPLAPVAEGGGFVAPHPALPGEAGWESTRLLEIQDYVLARSTEQTASLEVQRGGSTLFRLSRDEIERINGGADGHRKQDRKIYWLEQLWYKAYFLGPASESPAADAVRIVSALARYFVGVQELEVGPECTAPIAYRKDRALAGVPGDASPVMQFAQALARSEGRVEVEGPARRCFTALRPVGAVRPVDVLIKLPEDASQPISDLDVWATDASGKRVRIGVPVPPLGSRRGDDGALDSFALANSVGRLAGLTLLREAVPLVQVSRERIRQDAPLAGAPHLTDLEFQRAWLKAIEGWLPAGTSSAETDAARVAAALTSQLVGVFEIVVGARGYPTLGTGPELTVLRAGTPLDDTPARVSSALAVVESKLTEDLANTSNSGASVVLHQSVPEAIGEVDVSIDLPAAPTTPVDDARIWNTSRGRGVARPGVPAPPGTPLHRGRLAR